MAQIRYFHDDPAGATIELNRPRGMERKQADKLWPGAAFKRWDGFSVWIGGSAAPVWNGSSWDDQPLPVTRMVTFKSRPSLHQCDARCMHASGRTMNCECQCGGKNHGRGARSCT
jgi:hypothetical protein